MAKLVPCTPTGGGKGPVEISRLTARSSPTRAGCSELCPAMFCVSPKDGDATLTLGPVRCLTTLIANICFLVFQMDFLVFQLDFLVFQLVSLVLSLHMFEKSLALSV